MCRDRKRLLRNIETFQEQSKAWMRRAVIMRAMITDTTGELQRVTRNDKKWVSAWLWVLEVIEIYSKRHEKTEDYSI